MKKYKEVSQDEFINFIDNYPNKLEWDVSCISEPPIKTANDFSNKLKWPLSVVAKVKLNTAMKGHPLYNNEPDQYFIMDLSLDGLV